MLTDVPGNQSPARPVPRAGPNISAHDGRIFITGTGFLVHNNQTIFSPVVCSTHAAPWLGP